jgi:hypothetical protein
MMASKSKLKRLASLKRQKEHELNREKREKDKQLRLLGCHPDQIESRKQKRAADSYGMRRREVKLKPVVQTGVYRRETPNYPSVTSHGILVAEKRERNTYTGDKLLGISAMHKSNLVPIFSEEHAKDVSSMRRN